MGQYKDFKECIQKNNRKVKDAISYCGEVRAKIEFNKKRKKR